MVTGTGINIGRTRLIIRDLRWFALKLEVMFVHELHYTGLRFVIVSISEVH